MDGARYYVMDGLGMSEWNGPVGREHWMGFTVGWTIFLLVVFLASGYLFGNDHFLVALGAFSLMVIISLLTYQNHRPVWDYVYSSHKREGVLGAVEAALGDAGLEFTGLGPFRSRYWRSERWVLDLGATMVIVEEGLGPTFVYVGPLMEGNEADVERLKGLVDGALG